MSTENQSAIDKIVEDAASAYVIAHAAEDIWGEPTAFRKAYIQQKVDEVSPFMFRAISQAVKESGARDALKSCKPERASWIGKDHDTLLVKAALRKLELLEKGEGK